MAKLLSVLILSLMLLQIFLLPATVQAGDDESGCCVSGICGTITWSDNTLPVTGISDTTAVFNGSTYDTYKYITSGNPLQQGRDNNAMRTQSASVPSCPFYFEYGTTPGVYPYKVNAEYVLSSDKTVNDDGEVTLIQSDTYKASVKGLDPCTTYYVRFRWSCTAPSLSPSCFVYRLASVVTLTTSGCKIGPLGQGGAGTASGISTVPSWPKPVQMSNIVVQSAAIATPKVAPGEKVDVTASVTNKGTTNGDAKLTLYVNGQEADSQSVALAAGQTAPVHFYVSMNEPGTYAVHVGSVPAGSFTVDTFANNDFLIYGIIALFVLGIIGALYFIMRRRTA